MRKLLLFFLLATTVYLLSCEKEANSNLEQSLRAAVAENSPTGALDYFIMPESDDYANLPNQDPKNPVTKAKVELGRLLFFETGIGLFPKKNASNQAYSCSSCHVPSRNFTAGRFQGIADGAVGFGESGEGRYKNGIYLGDEVDAQGARPLPTVNLTYVTNALWAGTFGSFGTNTGTESVWNQDTLVNINHEGLEGLEANNFRALIVHRQVVNKNVTDSLGYTPMFDAAFPDIPASERYTRKIAGFAIAAYFRTILTNQAPFQKWLKGNANAMSEQQKRGAELFFGKAGCINCHTSPSFNQMKYFALGTYNLYQTGFEVFRTGPADKRNLGRGGFTGLDEDMHKFKVPQLYNMKDVGFYFHGASRQSLRGVVRYFNEAIPENPEVPASQIAGAFRPRGMSDSEMDDLVEFLENGLYDSNMNRYVPDRNMSGHCFPNNDPVSRADMGCH
jgi:cytochrome c peroxidase